MSSEARVVLVTGASTGFGRTISEHLAAQGYKVYGTSRRPQPAGGPFPIIQMDVDSDASVAAGVAEVIARESGCSIANAPIPILASCHKDDPGQLDRVILKRVELLPHASVQIVRDHDGLEGEKLMAFVRDQVRATYYVDRVITPIIAVTEDSLREAYRSVVHPFRKEKFDEARPKLKQWLVVERMRVAELEFLQGARARIRISPVPFQLPK